jgi:hypothetical protein
MKIFEIILDQVSNTALFEMAFERKNAINAVRGKAKPIVDHLIYLLIYKNSKARNHWKSELSAFIDSIDYLYLKPSKRKLSGNDYYNLLFEEPLGGDIIQTEKLINQAIRKEDNPDIKVNPYILKESLEKIIHKLSFDLANDQYISIDDYENF